MAQIIVAMQNNEPLDEIVYCEVMFSPEISGEMPEHRDFIYNVAIPKLEKDFGLKTTVLRSDRNLQDLFYHVITKGKNIGKLASFPIPGRCMVNRDCKQRAIRAYKKAQTEEVTYYVGIAADEKNRLERLKEGCVSLLAKYGVTEYEAAEICNANGLLSPVYEYTKRNGCWFCPYSNKNELLHIYRKHPDLWGELEKLQNAPNKSRECFTYNQTVFEVEEQLKRYEKKLMYKGVQLKLF